MKWDRLTKPRFVLAYLLAAWLFLVAHTTEATLRLGIAVVLPGEALRLWANGYVGHRKVNATHRGRDDRRVGQLITAGPYAWVRHPLYLGTMLLGVGYCIIVGNLWLDAAAVVFFLTVYRRKMTEEENLLREEIGDVYRRYEAAVPRWLPFRRRYADRQGQWSWRGLAASKEWKTVIWVIVILIALYMREEIAQEGDFLQPEKRLKHIMILGASVALMAADGLLELCHRRAKHSAQMMAQS